ncbi:MAG: TlyA family RNA methyltransferase [Proteobacteria bacterium]|nr:TlyA family RNA methyltransferase [Pseudomonadota bacterium]
MAEEHPNEAGRSRPGGKVRADLKVVEAGLAETRSRARALIMAGLVLDDGKPVGKAGQELPVSTAISLKDQGPGYVSRGGLKLEGALTDLDLDVTGLRALDVGASTGGFTDCLLQRGAAEVVAVDVGYGQLHWRLRQDPRVKVIERVNARYLTLEQVGEPVDLAVIDVSFISLALILPAVAKGVKSRGWILALVKPQFEVGRDQVGKGGVVRDPALRQQAVDHVARAARTIGLEPEGQAESRLPGPKGNREIFLRLLLTSPNDS